MVQYVYGGFTVMDAMTRDVVAHFYVDMSCYHLPPRLSWFYQPGEPHMPATATNDVDVEDDGADEDVDDAWDLEFLFLMKLCFMSEESFSLLIILFSIEGNAILKSGGTVVDLEFIAI